MGRIRNLIKDIRYNFAMEFGIWELTKDCIKNNLNAGEIVEIINGGKCGFYHSATGLLEDCSAIENVESRYTVRTSTGEILIICQSYYSFGFDGLADRVFLRIYNDKDELLYTSEKNQELKLTNKSMPA